MKEHPREHYKKQNKLQQREGCCRAFCCSTCRLSVSSSEEAESSNLDRFASISSLAHAMVQERLDQMIRERQEARHRDRSRKQIRDHHHHDQYHQGTRFIVMVAMEKCSYDPREDFRESMIEMIMANRIEEAKDLRSLLNYYMSMNSKEYHGIILEVFYEEPYNAMMKGNSDAAVDFFHKSALSIVSPMTVAKDTAFHIAVHSKDNKLLERLLQLVDRSMAADVFTANANQNTVLHEAAINCNIAAVKLLVEKGYVTDQEQFLKRNKSGQTPLFKAASFGGTKVVKYLALQPNHVTDNKLHENHRTRYDKTSILHAAVRGEHFGTAMELLNLDEGLAELKTKKGMTSLCLLTSMRTSAFSSKYRKQFWQRLVYLCIPTGDDSNDDAENIDDEPVQPGDSKRKNAQPPSKICGVSQTIYKSFWKYLIGAGWPTVEKIWKEKRKRKFALELASRLIERDKSWQTTEDHRLSTTEKQETEEPHHVNEPGEDKDETGIQIDDHEVETPLLAATRTGMIEIVEEILKVHPQAIEHINQKNQNILHVAASYRQREVFELVKEMKIPTSRLILGIDKQSYTVLQHVADTKNYAGGTRPGPAYKLQEELEWFKMVEDIMPSFFTKHRDSENKTAEELFKEKHEKQLKDAQKWIKETSQSCSAVAVLVATVVFAAAFTVPGGTNDNNGLPILLYNPIFLFFTISDVVSLSASLTSVVMFLSVLTSPFELDNFRVSLPRRLTLGFALLFISVATTMLAFTSTVFLIIRLEERQRWTLTLICCAAFFPVSVLALTHFPLFVSFILAGKNLFKAVWEALPLRLAVGCLTSFSKRLLCRKKRN